VVAQAYNPSYSRSKDWEGHSSRPAWAGCPGFRSIILVTLESEIKRITVQGQSRQIVHKTPSRQ
jgi:hypothetical protein